MTPRVLIVDDSAFVRTVLTRVLRGSGAIEVVGTARDGADALELIAQHDPDVITLDLTMPGVDGLAVLRTLAGRPRPRVIVVSSSSSETALGVEALTLGAVAVVAKPTALASDRLLELTGELIATVLATAAPAATRAIAPAPPAPAPPASHRPAGVRPELIAIGTSTGGPQALTRVLTGLPADLPAPVVVALHIPAGYTAGLAARLDRSCPLRVVEAHDGLALVPGLVAIARGGLHLHVERGPDGALIARLSPLPLRTHVPSVDELFLSAARAARAPLGIVLTGMGDDGLIGARAIAAVGGTLITEHASTCIVYGMPRCVEEAGLSAAAVPLELVAKEIVERA